MDPVTQGALGAAAALAIAGPRSPLSWGAVAWLGAAGGMAADLDVLIRSSEDSLLSIEYHRHFTHSLSFIPLGGALCGAPFLASATLRRHWRWVLAATTLGYATHALLDALTTYGTLLLWPWSNYRVSWRIVSVVDPLFTLPLLAAVIVAAKRCSRRAVWAGLGWIGVYLALCGWQHARAASVAQRLARLRGHTVERASVFPSFANNVTWRSLYQSGGRYYVDKIRVPWSLRACASPGTSVPIVGPVEREDLPAEVARGQRLIRWFSRDWVAYDPEDPTLLGDLRYSFEPRQARPIWGIRLLPVGASLGESTGVQWVNNNHAREVSWAAFYELLFSDAPDARCF